MPLELKALENSILPFPNGCISPKNARQTRSSPIIIPKPFKPGDRKTASAKPNKGYIEACFAAGMDDHLGKPIDVDSVFETLRKYLTQGARALVQDVAHGVDKHAVDSHFIMQVRAGGSARTAHIANQLAAFYLLPLLYGIAVKVRVAR